MESSMTMTIEYGGDLAGDGRLEHTTAGVAEIERVGPGRTDRLPHLLVHYVDGSTRTFRRARILRGSVLDEPVYPGQGPEPDRSIG